MKRGLTIRSDTIDGMTLERRMVTRRYLLELIRSRCVGCEMCVLVCPKEAIEFQAGVVEDGRLAERPSVDIDPDKCNFCGECVLLCPVNALRLTINGQVESPVLEHAVFPVLTREISVNGEELLPQQVAACESSCPTSVITVDVERDASGEVSQVLGIRVAAEADGDSAGCIYCQQCEAAFPGVFRVTMPWQGRVLLDEARCPEGCQACVDICPTEALAVVDGRLKIDERFCLYCGACQQVCPVEGALVVERARVLHTPVKSAAWTSAVERLISAEAAAQELDAKSQGKRRLILRYLPGAAQKEA